MEQIQAVVIGAGQAGLSMSHHLGRLGVEHVVLERGRIAERWRSERWDSLVFQFPNWMLRLPGHAYAGNEPDGFMPRAGVVHFLQEYARRTAPPIRCGVRVTGLHQAPSGHLRVETDSFSLEALHVVVATGPYQRPFVPGFSNSLPTATYQITANCYTNAQQLPPGGVLVVGSGGSGWQIAEDVLQSDHRVYLSVGHHRRVPRRYRGKDFGWWQEQTGAADQVVDDAIRAMPAPLLTGAAGGHDADLRDLARRGVTLLGSLGAVTDGRLRFVADLHDNLVKGDETFDQFRRSVDAYILRHRLPVPEAPSDTTKAEVRLSADSTISELDVRAAGITSVIWAVGYQHDFGWIRCAALDAHGRPIHRRGVSPTPGLYFLGLPRLHKVKSAFLWGVGDDAAHLAAHIRSGR
jgi:putative flavoprotein involved in K+ transport